MDISKLKKANELNSRFGKFLSTAQLQDLAERKIVPHYILINPLTGEESTWFQSTEVENWLRVYFRSVVAEPQTELIFLNFKTNECHIEPHDNIPEGLSRIRNLCKLPSVKINTPPGIYFLCQEKVIVYIGKALNVADRVVEHKRERLKVFDSVYFISCHADQLDRIECACIKFFKPKYNTASVNTKINEKEQKVIEEILNCP